jgi:transcriptional regulator with XRE-family HTH domain
MDLTKLIGQNIRKARLEKGVKLETLAKSIRVDKSTMSKIENGQSEITISRLEKIANALQIDYNILLLNDSLLNTYKEGYEEKNLFKRILDLSEKIIEISNGKE